jgi:hypothetical protein
LIYQNSIIVKIELIANTCRSKTIAHILLDGIEVQTPVLSSNQSTGSIKLSSIKQDNQTLTLQAEFRIVRRASSFRLKDTSFRLRQLINGVSID